MISIRDVCKSFDMLDGRINVLNQVTLDVFPEEFICLLGYSGCGKSTLLRLVSALDTPDSGTISIDGVIRNSPQKDVILLFQDFNQLFPWKTVLGNVMYPMLATKTYKKKDAAEEAKKLVEAVGLTEFANSYPHQLSGGMKQRVAVARALALKPKVLLMDEPFAALDAVTRSHLQNLTKQICKEYRVTVLFVTHSVEEAVLLGNRIVIMSSKTGSVEKIIENNTEHNKDSKTELVADIIDILDNQLM